jgi:hypothetical protein
MFTSISPAGSRPRPVHLRIRAGGLLALLAAGALVIGACSPGAASLPSDRGDVGAPPFEAPVPAVPGDDAVRSGNFGEHRRDRSEEAAATLPGGPLIVRTGYLSLEVAVLDEALAEAEATVAAAGGYVAASERSGDGERAAASVTYRIPVERWTTTLAALRAIGTKVLAEQTSSEDVTSQVVDLAARLANLRVTEAALQEIMARATRIPDILEVQAQLTIVREEIERLTAQQRVLEERAALATLTVGFSPQPVVAVLQVQQTWDPAAEVDRAAAALVALGQGLASAAIWAGIVLLPLTLFGGLGLRVVWLAVRRLRPRAPAGPAPAAPDTPVA